MPIRSISVLTCRRPVLQHPRSREGELQMQPVDLTHEFEIGCGHRARQVVHGAARDACGFGLFRDA